MFNGLNLFYFITILKCQLQVLTEHKLLQLSKPLAELFQIRNKTAVKKECCRAYRFHNKEILKTTLVLVHETVKLILND